MSKAKYLTEQKIVEMSKRGAGLRRDVPDGLVPNLFLRVGARTMIFVLVMRFPGARNPTRRKIGEYPKVSLEAARTIALKWKDQVKQGVDPTQAARRSEAELALAERRRFGSVVKDFIVLLPGRERNRHVPVDIATLENNLLTDANRELLAKPISEVTRKDLAAVIRVIRDRPAPGQAIQVLGLLKQLFIWAIATCDEWDDGYDLTSDPAASLRPKQFRLTKNERTVLLPIKAIRAYWATADETPYPYGDYFKAVFLAGVRKSGMSRSRWSEINWETMVWTIPDTKDKLGQPHMVPLSDALAVLFKEIKERQPEGHGDYIFSYNNGQSPINGFSKALDGFRERMATKFAAMYPDAAIRHWVIHDMRRVMRSALAALDVRQEVADAILGHRKKGMEGVYNQYRFLPQSRKALDRFASTLKEVLAGSTEDFYPGVDSADSWTVPVKEAAR